MKNFRSLLKICVLSFLTAGCCSGAITTSNFDNVQNQKRVDAIQKRRFDIENLKQSTVALVQVSNDVSLPYCSGVWVGKETILTAAHCVENKLIITYSTVDEYDQQKMRKAIVTNVDSSIDLALILAPAKDLQHPIVSLSTDSISGGDPVNIVGHPLGYTWTYMYGFVSSIRELKGPNDDARLKKIIQISAPVWMGVSGGGAYDENGNLLGICSWVSNGPHLSFFIHRDVINEFLKKNL